MVAGDENRRTGKERCLVSLLPFQGLTINKTSWAGSLPKPTTGHWRRVARLEWRFNELSKKQMMIMELCQLSREWTAGEFVLPARLMTNRRLRAFLR
jgi:hypothetical protein